MSIYDDKISLSVFLPFFNEERNIRNSVEKTLNVLKNLPSLSRFEVVIVDDGSVDKTGEIGGELANQYEYVRIISHQRNIGYGGALISGIKNSKYDYVFFTDGDLQFDICELEKFVKLASPNEALIGYRIGRKDNVFRKLNAKLWNLLNRLILGLYIKDIDCAFKMFRRDTIVDLPLISKGAMISSEILSRLKRKGVNFLEIPVKHFPRQNGKGSGAKIKVVLKAFKELNLLFWSDLGKEVRKQFIRFLIIGCLNTTVDFVLYFILTRESSYFLEHKVVSKIVSFIGGSLCSFFLNKLWTFGKKGYLYLGKELMNFYVAVFFGIVINALAMKLLLLTGLYDLVAVLSASIFTLLFNFTVYKLWVFKEKND